MILAYAVLSLFYVAEKNIFVYGLKNSKILLLISGSPNQPNLNHNEGRNFTQACSLSAECR